jgi:hypothetical protein
MVPNTAHIVKFALCELWSRTYTMHLQLHIFRLQYSSQRICAAIVDTTSIQCVRNLVPNTAHILRYTLCELWSRPNTKYFQYSIFRLQYSAVGICAAIVHITTIQCALYCKLFAKYNAHPPVYALWTVVPTISKVLTAPHIQALILNSRQLPCYCRYLDNSMRVILHSWCQIQRTSTSLRYATCGPGQIQSIFSSAYLGLNFQL